jgi:hypothetical protein
MAALALEELNRGLSEAELLHGQLSLQGVSAQELMRQLAEGGYLKPEVFIHPVESQIQFKNRKFQILSLPNSDPTSFSLQVEVSPKMLKTGLLDESAYVRLFTLDYLLHVEKTHPVILVLKGLTFEDHHFLVSRYGELLRSEGFLGKVPKKIPRPLLEKIKELISHAKSESEIANSIFFAVQYTDLRPKAEIPIIIHMLNSRYPVTFLVHFFKAYPRTLVEKFSVPFKEGYGDKWEILMEIFSHFTDSKILLDALYYSLAHRKEAHFAVFEDKIISTWEKMSKIKFEGDLKPFEVWLKMKKKGYKWE